MTTLIADIQALVEKWRKESGNKKYTLSACMAFDICADELSTLLSRDRSGEVSEDDVDRGVDAWDNVYDGVSHKRNGHER